MSRTPASASLIVVRGSTWEDEFTYVDDDGVAIDLTGYEARMQVRTLDGQFGTTTTTTLLMELATTGVDPLLVWDTAALGKLRIVAPPATHDDLNPLNLKKIRYAYAVEIFIPAGVDPEYVIPLAQGPLWVHGEIAR